VCVYAIVLLTGPNGFASMRETQRQLQREREQNQALQDEIRRLEIHNQRLQNDKAYRERITRQRTNKAKEGEVVIYLPDSPEPPKRPVPVR